MSSLQRIVPMLALTALAVFAIDCDQHASDSSAHAENDAAHVVAPVVIRDAGPPADRTSIRRVITFYRWQSTERGDESTDNQPIEHGTQQLHLVIDIHRDPHNQGWVTLAGLPGTIGIPENRRIRPLGTQGEWHVPPGVHTDYSLEQFGGDVRGDEPVRAYFVSAPDARVDIPVNATPASVRLPASTMLPATLNATVGQYDAILVFVIPVSNRHGGRYLVEALDLLPEPGGFAANGVMAHAPSNSEIERYGRWMRARNGIGRSEPPIAMAPIDR